MNSHFWIGCKGAAKWVAALVAGFIASDDDAAARAGHCAGCDTLKRYADPTSGDAKLYTCGPLLDEVRDHHCGCIVLAECAPGGAVITVNGVPVRPAAKTLVSWACCDQGKWRSVPRVGMWQTASMLWRRLCDKLSA